MSKKAPQELIDHIGNLLGPNTSQTDLRWAISLAHHNNLSPQNCPIEELDELMSADRTIVSEWLSSIKESGNTRFPIEHTNLFTRAANEEEAEAATAKPFIDYIEITGSYFVYDWAEVAELLAGTDIQLLPSFMAASWEDYAALILD